MATMAAPRAGGWRTTYGLPFVIGASSAGTIIEWYDFYLYATLTPFLAPIFFPSDNPTASLLAAFATYAAGFLVRPFGAVVFGRIGDVVGRKYAFLMTISIMGVATVIVGLLPTYASIGILAPTILLILRLAQTLGMTFVVVSHELPSVFTIADRAIMLDRSTRTIAACGPPKELRDHSDNPVVRQFFNRQPSVSADDMTRPAGIGA